LRQPDPNGVALTGDALLGDRHGRQVVLADPADDRVLEAARAFDADMIVNGDRHLLDLGTWGEIEIVSPAEFIATWSA
jgi:predicted nucleic acid-binding protein